MATHERLRLHKDQSGPLVEDLYTGFHEQLDQNRVEPNSGLGRAMD